MPISWVAIVASEVVVVVETFTRHRVDGPLWTPDVIFGPDAFPLPVRPNFLFRQQLWEEEEEKDRR